WRKFRGVDYALGLFRRIDTGHDNTIGTCIQRHTDGTELMSGNAHQSGAINQVARTHQVQDVGITNLPMLTINPNPVPVATNALNRAGGRIHYTQAQLRPALNSFTKTHLAP